MTSGKLPSDPLGAGGLNHGRLGLIRHRAVIASVNVGDSVVESLGVPAGLGTGAREGGQALTQGGLGSRVGKGGFNVVEERRLGLVTFEEVLLFL